MPVFFFPAMPKPKKDDKDIVGKTILKHTKKHSNIIHGRMAVNVHLPERLHRRTQDYDIFSKTPRQHMDTLEDRLDEAVGYDAFAETTIELQDTGRLVYRVVSKLTGREVADFMKMPKGVKYKLVSGVRYETLEHAKKMYKELIGNPNINWSRRRKSEGDLQDILAFEQSLKKVEKEPTHIMGDLRVPAEFRVIKMQPMWR